MDERRILTYDEVLAEADKLATTIQSHLQKVVGLTVTLERVRAPYEIGKLYRELRGIVAGKIWPVLLFSIDGVPSKYHDNGEVPERGVVFDLIHRATKDQVCSKIKFGIFVRGTNINNPALIREQVEAGVIKFREHGEKLRQAAQIRTDALDRVRVLFPGPFQHEITRVSMNNGYVEGTSTHETSIEDLIITWAYLKENPKDERIRIISTVGTELEETRELYLATRRHLEADYLKAISNVFTKGA